MNLAVLVLAAGEGTRMRSQLPKVAHPVLGRPLLGYVLAAARLLQPERLVVVIGHRAEQVRPLAGDATVVVQDQQLGTAHAVMVAEQALAGFVGTLLVVPGDTPLLTAETLGDLLAEHKPGVAATVLTARMPDPHGYGRVIRDPARGTVTHIVEEKDADPQERAVDEVNSGIYAFDTTKLFPRLGRIQRDNAQGEFYLTDVVSLLVEDGEEVHAVAAADHRETLGVNSREQLAEALRELQRRINRGWMERGVTIVAPEQTFIGPDVGVGVDSVIWPGTILEGRTTLGARCRVGPNSRISDSIVGDDACIEYSIVRESRLGRAVRVGPNASLRPGTMMADGAEAGTFVELKSTEIGERSKVPHLSYIGDAHIGKDVNVGAGSITCNYDGYERSETVIDDGAFVGSDTMLIAPVRVGRNAVVAAGSAISKDVPDDSLAIERADQKIMDQWARKRRQRKTRGA